MIGEVPGWASEGPAIPPVFDERELLVTTALDEVGRKRPRAPWIYGHAYPAKWKRDLPDDLRPETDLATAGKWAGRTPFDLAERDCSLPEESPATTLSLGAILPRDRGPAEDRIALIDWDDVRDPETGEIHPVCQEYLDRYGGFTELSQSGTGIHQIVFGALGDRGGKFIATIDDSPAFGCLVTPQDERDEDWEAEDDHPQVEVYDGGRHIMFTGELIGGASPEVRDGQDLINEITDRFASSASALPAFVNGSTVRAVTDSVSTEPDAEDSDREEWNGNTADPPEELPMCYKAALAARTEGAPGATDHDVNVYIGQLGLNCGYDRETVAEHIGDVDPGVDVETTEYHLEHIEENEYSPPSLITLDRAGILPAPICHGDCPIHGKSGEDDEEREDEGDDWVVHEVLPDSSPTSNNRALDTLPFAAMCFEPDVLRRYAKKRGLEWPSTEEVRDRLDDVVRDALEGEEYTVVDAPTSAGKTHKVVTTEWLDQTVVPEAVTADRPVVVFCETHEARDQAMEMAEEAGIDPKVLLGYKEACDVAGKKGSSGRWAEGMGGEDDERVSTIRIEGIPGDEWFEERVENRGMAISVAHEKAVRLAEQGEVEHEEDGRIEDLPCCEGNTKCTTETQWPNNGFIKEERMRCSLANHTVDGCEKCGIQRERCDDAGTKGHSVEDCQACHAEKVRCDSHQPSKEHRVDECERCFTEKHPRYDLVLATDPFAFVPSLRQETNIIHDEQPDYRSDLTDDQDRIRRLVTNVLRAADAPREINTFEDLFPAGERGGWDDAPAMGKPAEQIRNEFLATFDRAMNLDRDWYFEAEDAHTLAPALAKAIYYAAGEEPDENGRRSKTVPYRPPRLDDDVSDEEGWNRNWITVVLDDENTVTSIREAPDFQPARSVVGLDAWPTEQLWQCNVNPGMQIERVLDPTERQLWRRIERGLTVVQVGDATRPPGGDGQNFTEEHAEAVIRQLRAEFGDDFQRAGCASAVEDRLAELLRDAGATPPVNEDGEQEPLSMHFGEEKSRNDFAEEVVGLVYGCIDPGDGYVLDLLAECGLDATPGRTDHECEHCNGADAGCSRCGFSGQKREHGRTFDGPDAENADALLASVRENHVAQMSGRFGRNLPDEESGVVFVATDATPPGFVDYQVPGVLWLARPTEKQRALVKHLRENQNTTASEAQQAVAEQFDSGCSKQHAHEVFRRLVEQEKATVSKGSGAYGADEFDWLGSGINAGSDFASVDLGTDEIINSDVWNSHTWRLTIPRPPSPDAAVSVEKTDGVWGSLSPQSANEGDPTSHGG